MDVFSPEESAGACQTLTEYHHLGAPSQTCIRGQRDLEIFVPVAKFEILASAEHQF